MSVGAVEYTDCISAEEYDPPTNTPNECSGYDTRQSNAEALGSFRKCYVLLYCHYTQVHNDLNRRTC